MDSFPPEDFDIDLAERRVIHKPSGIWFSFYEYRNEADWRRSDSVIYHDNPDWKGDRRALAAAAKAAALRDGMGHRRAA